MLPADPVVPWIPDLERARAGGLDLPLDAPAETHRVAALVVHADMMRRDGWEEETLLSEAAADRVERGEPPAPTSLDAQSYLRLGADLGQERCSMCPDRPGRARCRICHGVGRVDFWGGPCSCGSGYVACPQCEGSGEARRVRVRYVRDEPIQLREIYVPKEMGFVPALFPFEGSFERTVGAAAPPEALRCHDLRPREAGASAYRGGGKIVEPDFHGYRFAGTVDVAVEALRAAAARGRIVAQAIRAYAWPLLWLRYRSPEWEVVLFVDPGGAPQVFQGAPPPAHLRDG
ncbi:MAG: hypothetical protein IT372_29790 [Polyangiaceae bacterium]|nr:hypothetical protein [Polyangiaceae bacterium]